MRMISLRDKRGQEGGGPGVTVGVIVAILVLVLLAFFVYYGYDSWRKGVWQKSTISVAAQACEASCVGNDKYGYCSQDRIVELSANDFKKYETILNAIKGTDTTPGTNTKIKIENRKVTATCNEFAKEQELADWSISPCNNIEC